MPDSILGHAGDLAVRTFPWFSQKLAQIRASRKTPTEGTPPQAQVPHALFLQPTYNQPLHIQNTIFKDVICLTNNLNSPERVKEISCLYSVKKNFLYKQ